MNKDLKVIIISIIFLPPLLTQSFMIELKKQEVKKELCISQGLDKKIETTQAGRHLIERMRSLQKI